MQFSDRQVEMMREELRSIYFKIKLSNDKYSFPTFWDEINDHFEDLPVDKRELLPENLRSIGRVQLEQKDNFRKFVKGTGRMAVPGAMEAIYFWLVDEENEESTLCMEAINKENPDIKLYHTISQFFNPAAKLDELFEPIELNSSYSGEYQDGDNKKLINLDIKENLSRFCSEVSFSETNFDGDDEEMFEGGIITTENDNIILILRSEKDLSPKFLISNSVIYTRKVEAFSCIDVNKPCSSSGSVISILDFLPYIKDIVSGQQLNSLKFLSN